MKFVIPNIIFIIIIALSTIYLTFLTTKGNLTNNKFKRLSERITFRGKLVFLILIWMTLILSLQECNNRNISVNNEKKLKIEQQKKNFEITKGIKKGVDSSTTKLFENLSKAFSKEGLRIDTLTNTVQKLKDSIKTTVNNYAQPDPVFFLDSSSIAFKYKKENYINFNIAFKSSDAGSSNHQISTYILTQFTDDSYDISKINFFPQSLKIPKDGKWKTGFNIPSKKSTKEIYIYLKGGYKNLDGSKTFSIDNLYSFIPEEKSCALLLNKTRNKILKLIETTPEKFMINDD